MIEVKNLVKRYGDHTAVDHLSFEIEKGKIYGFLGPNGAGKSTTMNIMTGCLAATSGEVTIGGYDIFEDAKQAKRLIGYLPEQPPVYLDRTPWEYLTFVARAKGIPQKEIEGQIHKAMEATGIGHVAHRLIKNLSKGYKQRVGIAQALLGDPAFLIFDEPTVGLDPEERIHFRNLFSRLAQDRLVLLSTHIIEDVQSVCSRLLVLHQGRLRFDGTPEELIRAAEGHVGTFEARAGGREDGLHITARVNTARGVACRAVAETRRSLNEAVGRASMPTVSCGSWRGCCGAGSPGWPPPSPSCPPWRG